MPIDYVICTVQWVLRIEVDIDFMNKDTSLME